MSYVSYFQISNNKITPTELNPASPMGLHSYEVDGNFYKTQVFEFFPTKCLGKKSPPAFPKVDTRTLARTGHGTSTKTTRCDCSFAVLSRCSQKPGDLMVFRELPKSVFVCEMSGLSCFLGGAVVDLLLLIVLPI